MELRKNNLNEFWFRVMCLDGRQVTKSTVYIRKDIMLKEIYEVLEIDLAVHNVLDFTLKGVKK